MNKSFDICSVVTFLHTSRNTKNTTTEIKAETPKYKNKSEPGVLIYRPEVKLSTHRFT